MAPEAEAFYRLLDAPNANAVAFGDRMRAACGALEGFASVIATERTRLADLEEEARAFHDRVVDGVESLEAASMMPAANAGPMSPSITVDWDEDTSTFNENAELWERYQRIHERLQTADAEAAETILALREADVRLPGQPGGPEVEADGEEVPPPPWGEVTRGGGYYTQIGSVLIEQFGPFIGYNLYTGTFDCALAKEAWSGLGAGIVDLASLNGMDVAVFVAAQWAARSAGGYVPFNPDDPTHRVIGGIASGLTLDLFSDDLFSIYKDDPAVAAATWHTMGLSLLVGGPLGAGARVVAGSVLGRLLDAGTTVVGGVRIVLERTRIVLIDLATGWQRTPNFATLGPDADSIVQRLLQLHHEQRGGGFGGGGQMTPDPRLTPDTPRTPTSFTSSSGAEVIAQPGRVTPQLTSQVNAPARYTPADAQAAWANAYRNADGVRVDPRTGVPLVGGPPGAGPGPRSWVMFWDEANGTWVAGNRGLGWAGESRFGEAEVDAARAATYASRDASLPGVHPPTIPAESVSIPDRVSGVQHMTRSGSWVEYQLQIAGYQRTPDGRVPEWIEIDPDTGAPVAFDGRVVRDGTPPQPVLLDAKDGYAILAFDPTTPPQREWHDPSSKRPSDRIWLVGMRSSSGTCPTPTARQPSAHSSLTDSLRVSTSSTHRKDETLCGKTKHPCDSC